jgi:hypothetical protein
VFHFRPAEAEPAAFSRGVVQLDCRTSPEIPRGAAPVPSVLIPPDTSAAFFRPLAIG